MYVVHFQRVFRYSAWKKRKKEGLYLSESEECLRQWEYWWIKDKKGFYCPTILHKSCCLMLILSVCLCAWLLDPLRLLTFLVIIYFLLFPSLCMLMSLFISDSCKDIVKQGVGRILACICVCVSLRVCKICLKVSLYSVGVRRKCFLKLLRGDMHMHVCCVSLWHCHLKISLLLTSVQYGHIVSASLIHFTRAFCPQCVCAYHCADYQECDREMDRKGNAVILSAWSSLRSLFIFVAERTLNEWMNEWVNEWIASLCMSACTLVCVRAMCIYFKELWVRSIRGCLLPESRRLC